jgi:hypothetical protein
MPLRENFAVCKARRYKFFEKVLQKVSHETNISAGTSPQRKVRVPRDYLTGERK